MLINKEEKEKFIEKINKNYRTILSYGEDGLIPAGEFIVTDIQEDDIPEEYKSRMLEFKLSNIILTKVDDENVQIILPMTTFLTKYCDLAKDNADKLLTGSDFEKSVENVIRKAESKVMSDETLQQLVEAETISLTESKAEYLINGEVQSSNYSICPIDLGKYRERIIKKDEEKSER